MNLSFIGELKPSFARISAAKSKVSVTAEGIGDVRIFWLGTDLVVNSTIVRDVLYVPEASDCLLSIGKLEDRGTELETKSAKKSILLRRNGNPIMRGYRKNRMWLVVHPADVKAYKSTERSGSSRNLTRQHSYSKVPCRADFNVSNHARLQEAVFGHHTMIDSLTAAFDQTCTYSQTGNIVK